MVILKLFPVSHSSIHENFIWAKAKRLTTVRSSLSFIDPTLCDCYTSN